MKKLRVHLFFILGIVLLFSNSFAQNNTPEKSVKERIDTIFKLANKQKYKEVAPYIVYTGSNADRKYKSPLNPADPSELKKAERVAKKIHAYVDISDTYELTKVTENKKDNLNQINAMVAFKSGAQSLNIKFTFIDVNGKILLVDID